MKSHVLHTVWCNISGEAAGEIGDWSFLGVKGLKHSSPLFSRSWQTCLERCESSPTTSETSWSCMRSESSPSSSNCSTWPTAAFWSTPPGSWPSAPLNHTAEGQRLLTFRNFFRELISCSESAFFVVVWFLRVMGSAFCGLCSSPGIQRWEEKCGSV